MTNGTWEAAFREILRLEAEGKLTMDALRAIWVGLGCLSLNDFVTKLRVATQVGGEYGRLAERVARVVARLVARTGAPGAAARLAGRAYRLASWVARGLLTWAALKWLLGLLAVGAAVGVAIWLLGGDNGGEEGAVTECPSPAQVTEKCPWTPEGYTVEPCPAGHCWDGGPQGSLACKQPEAPPNSHRNETNNVICDDGYEAVADPCTANLILECK